VQQQGGLTIRRTTIRVEIGIEVESSIWAPQCATQELVNRHGSRATRVLKVGNGLAIVHYCNLRHQVSQFVSPQRPTALHVVVHLIGDDKVGRVNDFSNLLPPPYGAVANGTSKCLVN
jgi:hypothetical protein